MYEGFPVGAGSGNSVGPVVGDAVDGHGDGSYEGIAVLGSDDGSGVGGLDGLDDGDAVDGTGDGTYEGTPEGAGSGKTLGPDVGGTVVG